MLTVSQIASKAQLKNRVIKIHVAFRREPSDIEANGDTILGQFSKSDAIDAKNIISLHFPPWNI